LQLLGIFGNACRFTHALRWGVAVEPRIAHEFVGVRHAVDRALKQRLQPCGIVAMPPYNTPTAVTVPSSLAVTATWL